MAGFVPSFKLNDRVIKMNRVTPMVGTVVAINPSADVYSVVWDGIGSVNPPWYTAQSLKLAKPEFPGYNQARERAKIARTILDMWNAEPATHGLKVGDRVMVLVQVDEGHTTSYRIENGTITAVRVSGAAITVLTEDNVYIATIASNVKRIR